MLTESYTPQGVLAGVVGGLCSHCRFIALAWANPRPFFAKPTGPRQRPPPSADVCSCSTEQATRARPWTRWLPPGQAWGQAASRYPPCPPPPRERRIAPLTRPFGPCPFKINFQKKKRVFPIVYSVAKTPEIRTKKGWLETRMVAGSFFQNR